MQILNSVPNLSWEIMKTYFSYFYAGFTNFENNFRLHFLFNEMFLEDDYDDAKISIHYINIENWVLCNLYRNNDKSDKCQI